MTTPLNHTMTTLRRAFTLRRTLIARESTESDVPSTAHPVLACDDRSMTDDDPHGEAGMATAEYAIGTLAAAAFAGILLAIMRSGSLHSALESLIQSALSVG